ncbi:hypothetical protein [Pedobacter steynii]|uniref:hypothetical protein n=1 Tax=Pedobacter steynii TaxID=430522 RepID=UPI0012F9B597|nr:hypothetical protein [Pedobacter steynii]
MGKKSEGSIVGVIVLVEPQPGSEVSPRAGELGHVVSASFAGDIILKGLLKD